MDKKIWSPSVTRIDAAAFISFFAIQLRRLFEGGVYSGAAFIQKSLYSVLNIVLHMVAFLLGNSNKSQYINVVHFVYSIVIFTLLFQLLFQHHCPPRGRDLTAAALGKRLQHRQEVNNLVAREVRS